MKKVLMVCLTAAGLSYGAVGVLDADGESVIIPGVLTQAAADVRYAALDGSNITDAAAFRANIGVNPAVDSDGMLYCALSTSEAATYRGYSGEVIFPDTTQYAYWHLAPPPAEHTTLVSKVTFHVAGVVTNEANAYVRMKNYVVAYGADANSSATVVSNGFTNIEVPPLSTNAITVWCVTNQVDLSTYQVLRPGVLVRAGAFDSITNNIFVMSVLYRWE